MPSAYALSRRSPGIIDHSVPDLCRPEDSVLTITLTERGATTVCCRPSRDRGFTLIELMIVVVVIGILASIAYPSYQNFVLRSHRADAQAEMMALAQAMERCYTRNNQYAADCVSVPNSGRYGYTLSITEGTWYKIEAKPEGTQANDKCKTMTIDSTGSRNPEGCW